MAKKWLKEIFWPTADPDWVGIVLSAIFIVLGIILAPMYAISGNSLAAAMMMIFVFLILRSYVASVQLRIWNTSQPDVFGRLLKHLQLRLSGQDRAVLETPDGALVTIYTSTKSVAGVAKTTDYGIFEAHEWDNNLLFYRDILVMPRYHWVQVVEDVTTRQYGTDGKSAIIQSRMPELPSPDSAEFKFILEHSYMVPSEQLQLLKRLEASTVRA